MSLFEERFRARPRGGFIPFIVAGDPDLDISAEIISALSRLAPIAVEVGVPFSDPTADGPVIQRSSQRALRNGANLKNILAMLRQGRRTDRAPIVLFGYYNPILRFGIEEFARAAQQSGVAGVLAVDLPAEAAASLQKALRAHRIDLIFLVAPTTSDQRLQKIVRHASGFIYAVARTGVTGTAKELGDESQRLVRRIRSVSNLPVAVGFGITNLAQASRVWRYADAAVIGSRLVGEIETASAKPEWNRAAMIRSVIRCARKFT